MQYCQLLEGLKALMAILMICDHSELKHWDSWRLRNWKNYLKPSQSKVTIENQSQVVEQFEDDVLPIAGIMSLKSLNINPVMSVIKYKELTGKKIPTEIIWDQFSLGFHNKLGTFADQVYFSSIKVTYLEELELDNYRYYVR